MKRVAVVIGLLLVPLLAPRAEAKTVSIFTGHICPTNTLDTTPIGTVRATRDGKRVTIHVHGTTDPNVEYTVELWQSEGCAFYDDSGAPFTTGDDGKFDKTVHFKVPKIVTSLFVDLYTDDYHETPSFTLKP